MLNIQLFKFFNSFAGISPTGDKVIIFLASTFGILIIILAIIFLFWHTEKDAENNVFLGYKKKISEIVLVLIVSAVAWGIATLFKNLIHHPRPYAVLEGVHKLFSPDDPFSLPSGHATFFAALATAIYCSHRRIGFWFAVAALIIGVSRIISGIHYPSDVLTGFGIGILVAGIVAYLRKKV